MRFGYPALTGLTAVALIVSGAMTFHYRSQALNYRNELSALLARLGASVSGDATPSPVPASASTAGTPASSASSGASDSHATLCAESAPVGSAGTEEMAPSTEDGDEAPIPTQKMRVDALSHQLTSLGRKQHALEQAQEAWNRTTNYFANRNMSGMTTTEQAEYNRMLALLDETWRLKQSVLGSLPYDERRVATVTIQSNMVALASLLEKERDRQYRDLAAAMVRTDVEPAAFPGYISQIASNTSIHAIFPETGLREAGSRGSRGGLPFGSRQRRE